MAGEVYESSIGILVRPNVVPAFRPSGADPVKPLDDPAQGTAVIGGGGAAQTITLTLSGQASWSRARPAEVKRVVDRQRVYQKEPDGTVNKDNYVDVNTVKKQTVAKGDGQKETTVYMTPKEEPNIETIETNVEIRNPNWSEGGGGAAP